MEPNECADKLTDSAAEEFLFRCTNTGKICCPPVRTTNAPSLQTAHTTRPANHSNGATTKFNNAQSNKGTESHRHTTTNLCSVCEAEKKETTTPRTTTTTAQPVIPVTKFSSHRNFRLLPSKCGLNDFPNRITEGEEAELGEFPWMALVGFRERRGDLKWICGGTLINRRYVLTAAHCIYRQRNTVPMVRLGEHNLENATDCDKANNFCLDPPIDFSVEEVIPHEGWNSTTIKNDIALFRLPRDVEGNKSYSILPICLPFDLEKKNSSENVKYEVAGWGKTDWNSHTGSSVLRKASLSSISNTDCNLCKGKKKEKYCPITHLQMCAQGWKAVDVCKGDSGGPLMTSRQKTYQVGITSFKTSEYCGADNIPSIFTRVESYLDWILNNIKD
ncbi:UNVERIFIED_CONTAM: hypothetical protein PYX00_007821 [Menopon gallinae]|uniref:Peptidase S1 domain-containing protein n=1 Tax=Menopon gallinae TaxID=328185 RepID=A0AAW2HL92_9NEOP